MPQDQNALVWMDLEMTGLNPDHDRIIEIATIVTDGFLNILDEGPNLAINQPEQLLDGMDEWNQRTHGNSGLIARVYNSNITEEMADQQTVDFLREYVPKGKAPLCGNSITQDRRFLYRYMPLITGYLHYRNVDVTSIKELGMRWDPTAIKKHSKNNTHLALDDIRESIEELKFYRRTLFK